jgi:hypothetical protein
VQIAETGNKIESAGSICPDHSGGDDPMATRLVPKNSGDEKPAAKKASPKQKATPEKSAANGPAAPGKAKPANKAKAPSRSRKGTTVNAETAKVLRDAEAGKNLLHYPSLEAMFEDLGI